MESLEELQFGGDFGLGSQPSAWGGSFSRSASFSEVSVDGPRVDQFARSQHRCRGQRDRSRSVRRRGVDVRDVEKELETIQQENVQKDNQITLLTAMLARSCNKVDDLLKQKKMLQQKVRRVSSRSEQLIKELANMKEKQNEFGIQRVGDKKGTVGKSGSWLTPLGAVNLAVPWPLFQVKQPYKIE